MNDTQLFRLENVYFSSSTTMLLKDISLSIQKGDIVELTGESGQGKSLLLKVIGGILLPSEGNVYFEGKNLLEMSEGEERDFRKKVAMVFQDSALWANQNILQNLTLPLKVHFPKLNKEEVKQKISDVLDTVQFDKDLALRPAELSLGEQKKIAFARAMICSPQVLLLDECTASLDTSAAKLIRRLLKKFVKQGNTIIYISHSSTFKREFAGKRITISHGRIENEV